MEAATLSVERSAAALRRACAGSLALLLALSQGGCGSQAPAPRKALPYEAGVVDGGALDPLQKRALHYDTEIRPPSAGEYSAHSPEVIETEEGRMRKIVTYSRVYHIDQVYRSMEGPRSKIRVPLGDPDAEPELWWVKAVHAEVVDESGESISQEFMCHMVASLGDWQQRDARLALETTDRRWGTLSQGLSHKSYPRGFGIPVLSNQALSYDSQVLNINRPEADVNVRHRIVTHYVRDAEARLPMRAIANTYAQVMVLLNDDKGEGYFGVRVPDDAEHEGMSCAVGQSAPANDIVSHDGYGRQYSPHWVVEPGFVENRTLATRLMDIRYDTRIHAIDVHLHPLAQWLELRDLTTDEVVFRSEARQVEQGLGLRSVESFRSEEGLPVYADHEYAIVSAYDNPTGENQDAMAVMYLGIHDRNFDPAVIHDEAARQARRLERAREQVLRFRAVIAEDPQDGLAHAKLGGALLALGRHQEAIESFRTARALEPEDPRVAAGLEDVLARLEAGRSPSGP